MATTVRACTCHQSIWKDGKPLFAGSGYADLSDICLYYIGGIIKHAKAINAFTNPLTNCYKRLIPGFEAPVLLAYSARNRSASCRIPFSSPEGQARRSALPRSDGQSLSRLCRDADGRPRRHREQDRSGRPMDKDLYDLPPEELKVIPTVCGCLREALESLDKDRAFLKKGGVFNDDFIDTYIELKMEEVYAFEHTRIRSSSRCTTRCKRQANFPTKRGASKRPFFMPAHFFMPAQLSHDSQLTCLASGVVAANERRQHWTLMTVPTTSIGRSVTPIATGDSGTGEISSSAMPDIIQSTEKATAKSILGTPNQ